jgi:hypothetical protein
MGIEHGEYRGFSIPPEMLADIPATAELQDLPG